jgi:uncharacterized protein (DUF2236 family)
MDDFSVPDSNGAHHGVGQITQGAAGHEPEQLVFSPRSEIWRISREQAVLLGGQAAAILQIAHPRIALGVAEHSDFQGDSAGRLFRTLDAVYGIVFGTRREAEQIRRHIGGLHRAVRGDAARAGIPGKPRYSAFEPDLMMWVLATLVMAAIQGYGWAIGPLPLWRKRAYYQDMRRFGEYFGLDPAAGPQGWEEFQQYYREMLGGPELGSHPLCREITRHLIYPRHPWWMRWAVPLVRGMPCEFIPANVCGRLGLEEYRWDQNRVEKARRILRYTYMFLPPTPRYRPEYLQARRRMRAGQVRPPFPGFPDYA